MGWSCSKEAGKTMDKWIVACRENTGSQNMYKVNGKEYYWDLSRVEHNDGAITGAIMLSFTAPGYGDRIMAKRVGGFRIEPNGDVSLGPKFLKDASKVKR